MGGGGLLLFLIFQGYSFLQSSYFLPARFRRQGDNLGVDMVLISDGNSEISQTEKSLLFDWFKAFD